MILTATQIQTPQTISISSPSICAYLTEGQLRHAERWLTPGTEYAVPEKLPLPREWYKGWDLSSPSAAKGTSIGLTEADMGNSKPLCLFWRQT